MIYSKKIYTVVTLLGKASEYLRAALPLIKPTVTYWPKIRGKLESPRKSAGEEISKWAFSGSKLSHLAHGSRLAHFCLRRCNAASLRCSCNWCLFFYYSWYIYNVTYNIGTLSSAMFPVFFREDL